MRIVAAAVRHDGKIYQGERHGVIMQKIWDEIGHVKIPQDEQGFVTNTGLFLNRFQAGAVDDGDPKAVAWLHDVLEDCPITAVDLISSGVPPRIVDAVVLLTNTHVTYADYIQHVKASGNKLAIQVKIADLWDHLRPNCPERLRPRYEKALVTLGIAEHAVPTRDPKNPASETSARG